MEKISLTTALRLALAYYAIIVAPSKKQLPQKSKKASILAEGERHNIAFSQAHWISGRLLTCRYFRFVKQGGEPLEQNTLLHL